jgi:signal transduction histidine kinase
VLVLHDISWEERINNMRDEFLNLAAHELRTPLAGIIGFTSLLEQTAEDDEVSEDIRSILGNILKSAERLRSTISDLLDFNLSDEADVELKVFDLRQAVREAIEMLSPLAEEQQVQLNSNLPNSMPVFGNQKMVATAVGHLIENGIRYNKQGGEVNINQSHTPEQHKLFIADTGIGISRKDATYILQPFFQVDEHTTRRSTGMGLGLSITQRIVSLHQGHLDLQSRLGQGSTFSLSLPRFDAESLETTRTELSKIQHNFQKQASHTAPQESNSEIINQLEDRLRATQSQNIAYAKDLARIYQLQRASSKEREESQAVKMHTDRLALMGQLAAGIAHDLSNLIGPILGYSQILLRQRDDISPALIDVVERILGTSRRADILLRQMVNLSGKHEDSTEAVNINQILQEVIFILGVKLRRNNIDLSELYEDSLPPITGNPVQISQVLLNVLVNAIDAMPDGGVLTVKTALRHTENSPLAQIQIADTGPGIAPEKLPHIWEPYFTTKPKGEGTGLGLSMSHEIITQHSGKINVDSVLGRGTSFTILLPTKLAPPTATMA